MCNGYDVVCVRLFNVYSFMRMYGIEIYLKVR